MNSLKYIGLFAFMVFMAAALSLPGFIYAAGEAVTLTPSIGYNSATGQGTFTVDWEVSNTAPASGLTITASVPAGSTFAAAHNGGVPGNGNITWYLGHRPQGDKGSVSFVATIDAAHALNVWAASVVNYSQGSMKNGTAIPAAHSDARAVLGQNSVSVFSLGLGGEIILKFVTPLVKGPGYDLQLYGNGRVVVFISKNGVQWEEVGTAVGSAMVDIGSSLETYEYLKLADATDAASAIELSEGFQLNGAKVLHMFPFSCAVNSNIKAEATVNEHPVSVYTAARLDIVKGCGSGTGSGGTGTGLFNGYNPPMNDNVSTSTPLPTATSTTSSGTAGGGGNSSSGGGSPVAAPQGSVLGTSTSTPSVSDLEDPAAVGGYEEDPNGKVLGDVVSLPRTGAAVGIILGFLAISIIPFNFRQKNNA
jgi:hypothetical protein